MSVDQPPGYLAEPKAGTGPGLLVLHPWWGLSSAIRAFCDRLVDQGFVAFAPDLYRGQVADTIEEAELLSSALQSEQVDADLADALTFLADRTQSRTPGFGVIGFSLGAFFALGLSIEKPDLIRCVVIFYGTGPGSFQGARAAYLGHFAETDPYEPPAAVKGLEAALHEAGRPVTFYTYKGTGHWFFEPDRSDAYDHEAAELAWDRTVSFLGSALPAEKSGN